MPFPLVPKLPLGNGILISFGDGGQCPPYIFYIFHRLGSGAVPKTFFGERPLICTLVIPENRKLETENYPLMAPNGFNRATFLAIPAPWTTSTTSETSL